MRYEQGNGYGGSGSARGGQPASWYGDSGEVGQLCALYTIHIPTTAPLKPVVKLVRRSTWQGFEALLAQKCGLYGTILIGIDKDTQTAYLYAVGRANGLSTVIQSRGKLPITFPDPVYFRWKDPGAPLTGE